MPTKLSRYCEGVMEAGWLFSVIVVPIFFNIYSSRIFEPDKIAMLRTLALVILAAWIVKLVEAGGVRWERLKPGSSWRQSLRNVPLIVPVIALALIYVLATLFSVTPRVSLWGSYQRLQGTYTTLSYIMVFASMAANLRRREQVDRLVSVAILSSLPISLYGILQRNNLDPVPWGGDVATRIAANMGNSIFLGAFLIMVFPLTVIRVVESFEAMLKDRGNQGPQFARATIYVFIAALQVIALYFTGSRGPWLGWAASLVFLWLGLSLIWRARWLTISGVVLALLAAAFLVTLNIPQGPLESLRTRPEFGRLGQLLDAESRTGRVRTLIWQGAAELVSPHQPLEYPDGSKDSLNFFRPLIGYGPESMYVAYNPFYPPALTQVERRNASPDRSHNETWDDLVITGLLGLVVYLTLFGSVLYYGLKWLGLIRSERQRYLYLGLYLGGGLLSTVGFVLWRGWLYLGVALPFGMMLGVLIYMILASLSGRFEAPAHMDARLRAYLLLALLAALVAHFVEIHFGIAIAATRTYFWVYAGLLLLVGFVLPEHGVFRLEAGSQAAVAQEAASPSQGAAATESEPTLPDAAKMRAERRRSRNTSSTSARKKRRSSQARLAEVSSPLPFWLRQGMLIGLLMAVVIFTMGYLYITNANKSDTPIQATWASLTRLKAGEAGGAGSLALLALILVSWIGGTVLLASESLQNLELERREALRTWGQAIALGLGVSLILGVIFWLWHAAGLIALIKESATTMQAVLEQVQKSEGILTRYYTYLLFLAFGLAYFLAPTWPAQWTRAGFASGAIALVSLAAALGLSGLTNLRVIQADMSFKTGDVFARPNSWPVAITIYDRARTLAPSEDYYYLFLGRAYLEYARTLKDVTERDQLIEQAARDLRKAQQINPLNTDHTANLARLYSLWAATTSDPTIRAERASTSEDYFSRAVVVSPHNAKLWDEWALLYMQVLDKPEEALPHLERALELDPYYDWTYGLLGDYYSRYESNQPGVSDEEKKALLEKAAQYYSKALELPSSQGTTLQYSLAVSLGGVYAQSNQPAEAIRTYEQALELSPNPSDNWRIQELLAHLYAQMGDTQAALNYARQALGGAPEDAQARLQALIAQLTG